MSSDQKNLRVEPATVQAVMAIRMDNKLGNILTEMREMNDRLAAVEARGIAFDPLKAYQRKTLQPGETDTVYYYQVKPMVAFIYHVGCQWYENTKYDWQIDRATKEIVLRTIGNPTSPTSLPMRLDKPLIAERSIRWIATNNDTVPHVFEVSCEGILYERHIADKLGGVET